MGNQHKHEILSAAVKVAAFDESGIRRDFFNSDAAAAAAQVVPNEFYSMLGRTGISSSKLCFCTGEIACYSTFDGEKMRKLLFALYFFPVKKGKGRKNLWLKLSNTT